MKLSQALLLIPPGTHLKCGCERSLETGDAFGSAILFAEPPEGGWPDSHHSVAKFSDRTIAGISTDETDHEAFEHLVVHMIVKRYGTDRQRLEAQEQLDRRTQSAMPYVSSAAVKASW